jgi:DNA-binding response OmpR family regulator
MHALIIEDEPLIAMAIEDVLRDAGYSSFDFAVDAQEAIAAAQRKCPDLITSDVVLTTGNGMDAIEAICGEKPLPVVFITGNASDVHARLPGFPVVRKPFSTADVVAAVQTAVS